jgi:hypothetical protein
MLANSVELAIHISCNPLVKHYVETDGEGLLMELRMYQAKVTMGLVGVMVQYLNALGKKKKLDIGQVMNHIEMCKYLLLMDSLGKHFHYHQVFSTQWIKKHLHVIGGGVSGIQDPR